MYWVKAKLVVLSNYNKLDYSSHYELNLQVVMLDKNSTWAFGHIVPQYAEIFEDPDYPKHYPNTVNPEYACVNHAKYEVRLRAQ